MKRDNEAWRREPMMRFKWSYLAIAGFTALLSGCGGRQSSEVFSVAFTHVSVVDTTGGPTRHDMTVVVQQGRITELGKSESIALAPDSEVINATGKYLIPGLWDMHVHSFQSLGEDLGPLYETFFPLFVANGVTGVRDMNGSHDVLQHVRGLLKSGELRGPRLVAAGLMIDGGEWPFGSIGATSQEEGRDAVGQLMKERVDFIKIGGLTPRAAYFAAAEAADEAGLPFTGHVPLDITASEASTAGQKSIEHLDGVLLGCSASEAELRDEAKALLPAEEAFTHLWLARVRAEADALDRPDADRCSALFKQFADEGTWHVPTLVLKRATAFADTTNVADDPRSAYIPGVMLDGWAPDGGLTAMYTALDFERDKLVYARQLELVGELHRAGVQLMPGTDTLDPFIFPGFSLHDELELFVEAGLTPKEALQAATWNPARYLERTEEFGEVAVGKAADLVFLNGDPLEDIRNTRGIWAVVLKGELLDQQALSEILEKSRELAASAGGDG